MPMSVQRDIGQLQTALRQGAAASLKRLLQPYSHCVHPVGACNLFPTDRAYRFRSQEMNEFFIMLFHNVADILKCNLSQYDLHHGHIVYQRRRGIIAVLFHAKEYPAKEELFPYELGHCQRGSNLVLGERDMRFRCVLWADDSFWLLDGGRRMPFGTFYESEFGAVVADIYYFDGAFGRKDEALNRGVHVICYGGDQEA